MEDAAQKYYTPIDFANHPSIFAAKGGENLSTCLNKIYKCIDELVVSGWINVVKRGPLGTQYTINKPETAVIEYIIKNYYKNNSAQTRAHTSPTTQKEQKRGNGFKDLTGQRFGRLTVIKDAGRTNGRGVIWHCVCDCGNECDVVGSNLIRGHTQSCGCYNKEWASEARKKNLTGMRFGRLIVLCEYGRTKRGGVAWLCECECGNFRIVEGSNLISGRTKSCGCLRNNNTKTSESKTTNAQPTPAQKAAATKKANKEKKTYNTEIKNKIRTKIISEFKGKGTVLALESSELLFVDEMKDHKIIVIEENIDTYKSIAKANRQNVTVYHGDISFASEIEGITFDYAFLDFCRTLDTSMNSIIKLKDKLDKCRKIAFTFAIRGSKIRTNSITVDKNNYETAISNILGKTLPNFTLTHIEEYQKDKNSINMITGILKRDIN